MQTPAQNIEIKSDFAILDVKSGRKKLLNLLQQQKRVTVTIMATVDIPWGQDDGISQEFIIRVNSINTRVRAA